MVSLLPAMAKQLFKDVEKSYQKTCQIPNDLLIAMKFIFGSCVLPALDLVDQRSVTCLSSPSGRKVFQAHKSGTGPSTRGGAAQDENKGRTVLEDIQGGTATDSVPATEIVLFKIIGGSGRSYNCFLSCHYCPCPAFTYTVLLRDEGLLCKHILAVYLCQAMAVTQQESVSDQRMSALLSGTAEGSRQDVWVNTENRP